MWGAGACHAKEAEPRATAEGEIKSGCRGAGQEKHGSQVEVAGSASAAPEVKWKFRKVTFGFGSMEVVDDLDWNVVGGMVGWKLDLSGMSP